MSVDKNKRFTFVKDDSSHWYLVPLDELKDYEDLLQSIEDLNQFSEEYYELEAKFINKYDKYRINSAYQYSFTNPELID